MPNDILQTMWKKFADSPYIMIGLNKNADHSVPMHAQLDKNANGHFWFYTTTNNRIAEGGKATAQFASKEHDLFACFIGKLVEETDQEVITRYWSKQVEAWYPQGRNDPKLKMLRFELDNTEIWSVDPSVTGLIKLASGATLLPEEMGEHKKVTL